MISDGAQNPTSFTTIVPNSFLVLPLKWTAIFGGRQSKEDHPIMFHARVFSGREDQHMCEDLVYFWWDDVLRKRWQTWWGMFEISAEHRSHNPTRSLL